MALGQVQISQDGGATYSADIGSLKPSQDGGATYTVAIVRQSNDGGATYQLIFPPSLRILANNLGVNQHPIDTVGQDTELLLDWTDITNAVYDLGLITNGERYPFDEWRIQVSDDAFGAPLGNWADINSGVLPVRSGIAVTATGLTVDTLYWFRIAMQIKVEGGIGIAGGSTLAPWKESLAAVSTRKGLVTSAPAWFDGTYPKDDPNADQKGLFRLLAAITNATFYRLKWSLSPITNDTEFNSAASLGDFTEAQIISAELSSGTSWANNSLIYVAVRAQNPDSEAAPFLQGSFTNAFRIPGAPVLISVTGSGTSRTLTFDESSPFSADSYTIEFQNRNCGDAWPGAWSTAGFKVDPNQFVQDTGLTFLHSGLTAGKEYRWQVIATVVGTADSPASNIIAANVDTAPNVPGDPVINESSATTSSYEVTFTASSNPAQVDSYEAEVIGVASSFMGTPTHTGLATTTEVLGSLTDNADLKVRIRAKGKCAGEFSAWSGQDNYWTKPAAPASVDWFVNPKPKATTEDTIEYTTGGTDVDDKETYHISGSGTPDELDTLGGDSETTGLVANTLYSWRTRGRQTAGVGSPHSDSAWVWSTTLEATTYVDAPQVVSFTQDTASCPTIDMDLVVTHNNSNSDARSQAWEWRTNVNGGTWSGWTGASAGVTTVNGILPGGSGGDTINVETRYSGDTPTDSSSRAVLCVA